MTGKHVKYKWAISIYSGISPDQMKPIDGQHYPTLTADIVDDMNAEFVADPFMIKEGNHWYLFFEALNSNTGKGEICYATSDDLSHWTYGSRLLEGDIHYSYPHVLRVDNEIYMIPETRELNQIGLYKATNFPTEWEFIKSIFEGNYADATPFNHNGHWYILALNGINDLHLLHSPTLTGQWETHPASPIRIDDINISRPAGRIIKEGNKLYRLAQDGQPIYGSRVRMLEIIKLDPSNYEEIEIDTSPILKANRKGWNSIAMHHLDAHKEGESRWIGCVDGASPVFNLLPQ